MSDGRHTSGRTLINEPVDIIRINAVNQVINLSTKVHKQELTLIAEIDTRITIANTTLQNAPNQFNVSAGEVFNIIYLGATSYMVNSKSVNNNGLVAGLVTALPYTASKVGNWLKLNGQPVSRVDYINLFAVYGVDFGGGDGSTTFNLPNATDCVIGSGGIDIVGSNTHALIEAEMPSHTHTGSTATAGNHKHTDNRGDASDGANGMDPDLDACVRSDRWEDHGNHGYDDKHAPWNTTAAGDHAHALSINSAGAGQVFSLRQKTFRNGNLYVFGG